MQHIKGVRFIYFINQCFIFNIKLIVSAHRSVWLWVNPQKSLWTDSCGSLRQTVYLWPLNLRLGAQDLPEDKAMIMYKKYNIVWQTKLNGLQKKLIAALWFQNTAKKEETYSSVSQTGWNTLYCCLLIIKEDTNMDYWQFLFNLNCRSVLSSFTFSLPDLHRSALCPNRNNSPLSAL